MKREYDFPKGERGKFYRRQSLWIRSDDFGADTQIVRAIIGADNRTELHPSGVAVEAGAQQLSQAPFLPEY